VLAFRGARRWLERLGVVRNRLPGYVLARSGVAAAMVSGSIPDSFDRWLPALTSNQPPYWFHSLRTRAFRCCPPHSPAGSRSGATGDAIVIWSLTMFLGSLCFLQLPG
jgi:hypothetical protein